MLNQKPDQTNRTPSSLLNEQKIMILAIFSRRKKPLWLWNDQEVSKTEGVMTKFLLFFIIFKTSS